MKKTLVILMIMAFLPAQTLLAQKFSIGAGASAHVFLLHEDNDISARFAPGASLDFELSFPFTQSFTLATGVSVSGVAGYHFAGRKDVNLGEIYVDIPLRAKLYIELSDVVDLIFFTGPVFSVNALSANVHGTSNMVNNYSTYPNLRRFDVMLGAGTGVELSKRVRISLGFDYGLMDRNTVNGNWAHHGQFKLGAQYIF